MVSLINAYAGGEQSDPVQSVPDTGLLGSLMSGSLAPEHKPLKTIKTGAGILTFSPNPQRHTLVCLQDICNGSAQPQVCGGLVEG